MESIRQLEREVGDAPRIAASWLCGAFVATPIGVNRGLVLYESFKSAAMGAEDAGDGKMRLVP